MWSIVNSDPPGFLPQYWQEKLSLWNKDFLVKQILILGILSYLVSSDYPNLSYDYNDNYNYLKDLIICERPYIYLDNFTTAVVDKYDARQIWNILSNVTVDECTQ